MNARQKNTITRITSLLLLTLTGGIVGFFGAQAGIKAAADLPLVVVISTVLLIIPAFLLVIAFHEAGHALAGVILKFDFRMFVVGPFLWDKEQEGWKFKWNKNVNTSGGMVICIPPDTHDLNKRFSVYAAGGPLASLVTAGMAYVIHHFFNLLSAEGMLLLILSNFFLIIALLSAIIFFITAIPVHAGGFYSDGARVLRLWRGGETARFEMLLLKIISKSMAGTRPANLDINELNEAMALANTLEAPMGVYLHYFFYYYAFDRQEWNLAEDHLTSYLRKSSAIPSGIRDGVWVEAAFFYACVKKDEAAARDFLNRYKPSALIPKASVWAAEAALSGLRNDTVQTNLFIKKALAEIPNMMDRGVSLVLLEKLLQLKQQNSEALQLAG